MDPVFLAYFGKVLVLAVSGIGSIVGVSISASAAIGAMKKDTDQFGFYLVFMTPPATNGLYGFLGYFIFSDHLIPEITWFQSVAIFSACLSLGLLNLFSAIRQGQVCAHAMAALSSGHNIFGKALIVIVFIELYAIIGLAALFLVYGTL